MSKPERDSRRVCSARQALAAAGMSLAFTRGDRIDIERSDGSTAMFRVTRAETHHKDQFPTKRVYGNTRLPTLRLITCTGSYDAGTGYRDNLIVFAEATGGR